MSTEIWIDTSSVNQPERPVKLQVVRDSAASDDEPTTSWRWIDLKQSWENKGHPIVTTVCCVVGGAEFCLFYPGRVNSVYGKYESGKTWLMKLAVVQLATSRYHVMYLDFEDDSNSLTGDLLRLGLTLDEIHEFVHYASIEDACEPEHRDWLLAEAQRLDVRLAVIDGTTEAMSLEHLSTMSTDDFAEFTHRYPKQLAKVGPGVVMLDHTAKADKQGESQIGTQHKGAAITGAQYFMRPVTNEPLKKGSLGRANIYCRKDRPGSVRPFEADPQTRWVAQLVLDSSADDGTSRIYLNAVHGSGEPQLVPLDAVDQKIMAYLKLNREKWFTSKEVWRNTVPNLKDDTVKRHLEELADNAQQFVERRQAYERAPVYFGLFPDEVPDVPDEFDE